MGTSILRCSSVNLNVIFHVNVYQWKETFFFNSREHDASYCLYRHVQDGTKAA
jgi:hypothetical protein